METVEHRAIICLNSWVVVVLLTFSSAVVRAHLVAENVTRINSKSILKTIKSEDGDIIDCVDVYKQPAFNHPLLANHTLQMKPSSYPVSIKEKASSNNSQRSINQSWPKNEAYCPEGTIPIRRCQSNFSPKKKSTINSLRSDGYFHEYAVISMTGGNYYGTSAKFNVWNPPVVTPDISVAQIWMLAGELGTPELNTIEAGWMVGLENNADTRLFVYWTSDNYGTTGCYNLDCPGFVQTSYKFGLGTSLTLYISKYGGDQFETSFNIHKDMKSGNWWLRIQDEDIGYWPVEIFKNGGLSRSSTKINYGGEITNTKQQGLHTKTNMGSGHFADEGWSKAALVRNIEYVDDAGALKDAADQDITAVAVRPDCYSVVVEDWEDFDGTHFYYGGPGYSDSCKN